MGATRRANALILGTAEWDAPIATNQHYVTRELARIAFVYFVETLGLRRPQLTRADMTRMAARIGKSVGAHGARALQQRRVQRQKPDGVCVVSPLVLPVHRAATRLVNRAMLRRATARWISSDRPRVLWTFTPVTYGLEAYADVAVYHCVDLLAQFPGVDAKAIAVGERNLSRGGGCLAIATSDAVRDHLVAAGFSQVILLPNVADVSLFGATSRPAGDRRPAALFCGNLSPHKVDDALLESIAAALRGRGELLLAGPIAAGGGDFAPALRRLERLGAVYLGVLSPLDLAAVAGRCTVGLIPYALNEYTRGVSPLKCFEYLAAGLGVVSTRLPEVQRLARTNPHVLVLEKGEIPDQVLTMVGAVDDATIDSRVRSALGNGWEERGQVLRELLDTQLTIRLQR